jgi:hypothetical protein
MKMTELLDGLDGIEDIIDDILVYGKTRKEHDKRLDALFEKIHLSGFKLNRDKCEFRMSEIEYLGHVISSEGIRPSNDRIRTIRELKPPTNLAELCRLVGLVNYLGRFVPDLATVISSLTDF